MDELDILIKKLEEIKKSKKYNAQTRYADRIICGKKVSLLSIYDREPFIEKHILSLAIQKKKEDPSIDIHLKDDTKENITAIYATEKGFIGKYDISNDVIYFGFPEASTTLKYDKGFISDIQGTLIGLLKKRFNFEEEKDVNNFLMVTQIKISRKLYMPTI